MLSLNFFKNQHGVMIHIEVKLIFYKDSCSYDSKGVRISTSDVIYMPDSLFISLDLISILILWAGNVKKKLYFKKY